MHARQIEVASDSRQVLDALSYEAPFVIEKLVKDHIVDTPEEGQALFEEVKRYLVLASVSGEAAWPMYSLRVDEAWHQFILFTRQYMEFCHKYFGRYMPHNPSNSPTDGQEKPAAATSFRLFADRYKELFVTPLPNIWLDAETVTIRRRVINDSAGSVQVRAELDAVDLLAPSGEILFSVNRLAEDALTFIAHTGAFYVRELPGDLSDDEKTALVSALMGIRILRSAP
ncbi:glycine-rich domain-containing protein [Streptomyces chartreusis]|uniref:glycine-rich domain-containing protein n=1 Tax=Streptomyces chartreusis TaxID=1969 RepID=UPI0037A96522